MSKLSSLKTVVTYTNTPYVVVDKGADKTQRFELWNKNTDEIVSKSNDPYKFDSIVFKPSQEFTLNEDGGLW